MSNPILDLERIELHYGILLPQGYRRLVLAQVVDYERNPAGYLWVHEAEWIPPADIPGWDLLRTVISDVIPFAFTGARDHWCWDKRFARGESECEVLLCYRDEDLADAYAPTFSGWFYRDCLDYASGGFDLNPRDFDAARANLRLWSYWLRQFDAEPWADHLACLAEREPFQYKHPKLRESVTMFGFITAMEVDEIVAFQFGRRYIEEKVAWEMPG